MKKLAIMLSTILVAGSMSVTAFAANPNDETSGYSFNTGRQSYESRMSQEHEWYDNEDESVTQDYSFNEGSQAAQSRNNAFAELPTEEMTEEELDAWFQSRGIGEGAAYSNGTYDESSKGSYGYAKGQAAYQGRSASFA